MKEKYVIITGTNHYYGMKPFSVGKKVKCFKEPDNAFDSEAIKVVIKGVYCKIKVPKVAKQKWTFLHVHFGHNCKALYHDSMERCSA